MIYLSPTLTSEALVDLFSANSSCPVVWTSNIPGIGSLKISAEGTYAAVGSSGLDVSLANPNSSVPMFAGNNSRAIWNYTTGINLPFFQTPSEVSMWTRTLVAISGDGRFVVTGNSQLTYMAVVSPNQTPYILTIAAGIAAAATVAFLLLLTFRKRGRHKE